MDSDDAKNKNKRVVLLTGFGPFGKHTSNPSWTIVQKVADIWNHHDHLVIEQVEVAYDYVNSELPLLWDKYNPDLVIHCGVSHSKNTIHLEKCAHTSGYERLDVRQCTGPVETDCDCLYTTLGVDDIIQDVRQSSGDIIQHGRHSSDDIIQDGRHGSFDIIQDGKDKSNAIIQDTRDGSDSKVVIESSTNAGRYLCEYIFFKSLELKRAPVLFIHVPDLTGDVNSEHVAKAVRCVIEACLSQLAS